MDRSLVVSLLLACVGCVGVGCGGLETEQGDGGASTSDGGGVGTGQGAPGSGGSGAIPVPRTSFSAGEVAAAQASCVSPHGPPVTPGTWGDLRARLVSSWLVCSTTGYDSSNVFATAITFDVEGTWQTLMPDGSGGLVAGEGVANQGTYSFYTGEDNNVHAANDPVNGYPWVTVAAQDGDDSPAGTFAGMLTFEASPQRMYATQSYYADTIDTWLVALP